MNPSIFKSILAIHFYKKIVSSEDTSTIIVERKMGKQGKNLKQSKNIRNVVEIQGIDGQKKSSEINQDHKFGSKSYSDGNQNLAEPNDDSDLDDGSDSDNEILLAVSEWAKEKEDEFRSPINATAAPYYPSEFSSMSSQNNPYSLHITNLPYNATKADIMRMFMTKGCEIASLRMVYNHHVSRGDRNNKKSLPKSGFTGVAFLDLPNEESYNAALQMDKQPWTDETDNSKVQQKDGRGWRRRKINVRPTKTKEELAKIVENTKARLATVRGKEKVGEEIPPTPTSRTDSVKRKHGDDNSSSPSRKKKKTGRENKNEKKLTKKEKARKAAILNSKSQQL